MKDPAILAETMARFDFLADQIEENNHPDEARKELAKHLKVYLEAGCDPNKIAKLIGPVGRYYYYRELTAHGARINIHKLARLASKSDFAWTHLEGFIERGADINWMLDILPSEYVYSLDEFHYDPKVGEKIAQRLLNLKADPGKVFDLMEGWMFGLLTKDELFDKLEMFVRSGLERSVVKRWLEEQLNDNRGELLYRLFNEYDCDHEFAKYGIDAADYANKYALEYGRYPSGYDFADARLDDDDDLELED